MTTEKPTLWRRQQELCSTKMHIDTSCLEIGTTTFDNATGASTIDDAGYLDGITSRLMNINELQG